MLFRQRRFSARKQPDMSQSPRISSNTVKSRTIFIHGLCWLIFITYELSSLYYYYHKLDPVFTYLCYYGINISLFYLNAKLLDYIFRDKGRRYFQGALLFITLVVVYLVIKFIANYLLQSPHENLINYIHTSFKFLPSTLFRISFFVMLSVFYWATGHISYFRKQAVAAEQQELLVLKEKAELEARFAAARNAYLTQQINPHLLFNSLNFIYNSVSRFSQEASNCVMLLSDLLRFSLEEAGADGKVPLVDEIAQLRRLLEINNYRFDGKLSAEISFGGDFEKYRIIPLILFTLTENVFKHGNLRDRQHPAELKLEVDNNRLLHFFSRNLKKSKSGYPQRSGTGLQNVRIRLDFAYPGKYSLDIAETGEYFELSLNLQL